MSIECSLLVVAVEALTAVVVAVLVVVVAVHVGVSTVSDTG